MQFVFFFVNTYPLNGVLLLDEAEDIFNASPFYRNSVSKVEINRLLENNTRPTIWITNNIKGMDKAYIRRFTKTVYFEADGVYNNEVFLDKEVIDLGDNGFSSPSYIHDGYFMFIERDETTIKTFLMNSDGEVICVYYTTYSELDD